MQSFLFLRIAAIYGALAVGLGAFGTHALKAFLQESGRLETYQTAVAYHFYHTLALLAISVLLARTSAANKSLRRAAWLFVGGIPLFSGSLYLLCFTNIGLLGAIPPLGGVFFIGGWLQLAWAAKQIFQPSSS